MKNKTKTPKDKLSIRQRITLKLREVPALLRAKKEEKRHLPTAPEIQREQKRFEKEAYSMKPLILRKGRKK